MTRASSSAILEHVADPKARRLVPHGDLLVPPAIALDGDWLTWWWPHGPFAWGVAPVPDDLLGRFLKLEHAGPKRFVQFARRWGVLGLCGHGLPVSHRESLSMSRPSAYDCVGLSARLSTSSQATMALNGMADVGYREPLSSWRMLAADARIALAIARRLRDGEAAGSLWRSLSHHSDGWEFYARLGLTPPEDAAYLEALLDEIGFIRGRDLVWWDRAEDKAYLAHFLNEWLVIGNVRPYVERDHLTVLFGANSGYRLFGAIAVQLVAAIAGGKWYLCIACDNWSKAARKPRPGERYFCSKCGRRASARHANRDRLERERLSRR